MKPDAEFVHYLYDCRCCRHRSKGSQRIFTTYQRSADQVIERFSKMYLETCETCGNRAVHDLVAISPEEAQG